MGVLLMRGLLLGVCIRARAEFGHSRAGEGADLAAAKSTWS